MRRFATSKFTNAELYNWLAGQMSTMFFQAYRIAYDLRHRRGRRAPPGPCSSSSTRATLPDLRLLEQPPQGPESGRKPDAGGLGQMETPILSATRGGLRIQRTISLMQLDPAGADAVARNRQFAPSSCRRSCSTATFPATTPARSSG